VAVLYTDPNKLLTNAAKDSKQSIVQYLITWSYPIRKFNAIMRKVHKSSLHRLHIAHHFPKARFNQRYSLSSQHFILRRPSKQCYYQFDLNGDILKRNSCLVAVGVRLSFITRGQLGPQRH